MSQITGQQLQQIGNAMWGDKWRKQMAEHVGLSYARISQLANVEVVPAKVAERLVATYTKWQENPQLGVQVIDVSLVQKDPEEGLTDQQILDRINTKFGVMDRMVDGMLNDKIRSLIVSGAPGIGKTFGLEKKVRKAHKEQHLEYAIIRGTCSAPGLYQALYHAKDGGIVVIDDCDSVFGDEQTFNILKTALDTTNTRTISWRKQSAWVYDVNNEDAGVQEVLGDRFPNEFDFEGAIVFITNLNFRAMAEKGNKNSPHFKALLSRSMYLDLTLHSMRARIIRIKDVFINSMVKSMGLTVAQGEEILDYVLANADRIDELSLRTMKHIGDLYQLGSDWKEIVEHTKMRS